MQEQVANAFSHESKQLVVANRRDSKLYDRLC